MAAGLGFKTFTTGEVLTAADTNGYLMQGVLVFASAAARDAAITSPQEGQFAYLKDTNVTTYYTGSAWANLDTTGMTNPMTTTGDTIYSSSGSTPARLGIGSTGQVLTVASGIPSWATPAVSASGLTFISKTAFTAQNTVSINSVFTSTYTNYYIVMDYISTTATDGDTTFKLRASGTDTSANYKCQRIYGSSTTVGASADVFGTDEIYIGTGSTTGSAPAGSSFVLMSPNEAKRTTMQGSVACNNNGANTGLNVVVGFQTDTTQFDGITFLFSQTNTGSIYIYGLAKA